MINRIKSFCSLVPSAGCNIGNAHLRTIFIKLAFGIFVGMIGFSGVSCQNNNAARLELVRSVGVSNGMGDRVVRNRVGVTSFSSADSEEKVPEVRIQVEAATVRNLKTRFQIVKMLQATGFSVSSYSSPFSSKNERLFKLQAIAAAKRENLDAVWIIYPLKSSIYEPGGTTLGAYEHWQQSSMGISREFATCSARAELVDVKSGEVIAQPKSNYLNFSAAFKNEFRLTTHDWKSRLADYNAAQRKEIIEGIAQAGANKMKMLLDDSGILNSDS